MAGLDDNALAVIDSRTWTPHVPGSLAINTVHLKEDAAAAAALGALAIVVDLLGVLAVVPHTHSRGSKEQQ